MSFHIQFPDFPKGLNYDKAFEAAYLLCREVLDLKLRAAMDEALFPKCTKLSEFQELAARVVMGLRDLEVDDTDLPRRQRILWLQKELRRATEQLKPLQYDRADVLGSPNVHCPQKQKRLKQIELELQKVELLVASLQAHLREEGVEISTAAASGRE